MRPVNSLSNFLMSCFFIFIYLIFYFLPCFIFSLAGRIFPAIECVNDECSKWIRCILFLPESNRQAQLLGSMFFGPDFWMRCIVHLEQIWLSCISLSFSCLLTLYSCIICAQAHTSTQTLSTLRVPSTDIRGIYFSHLNISSESH